MNYKTMKQCQVNNLEELFLSCDESCDEDTPSLRKIVQASLCDSCFNKLEGKTLPIFNEQ